MLTARWVIGFVRLNSFFFSLPVWFRRYCPYWARPQDPKGWPSGCIGNSNITSETSFCLVHHAWPVQPKTKKLHWCVGGGEYLIDVKPGLDNSWRSNSEEEEVVFSMNGCLNQRQAHKHRVSSLLPHLFHQWVSFSRTQNPTNRSFLSTVTMARPSVNKTKT